VGVVVVEVLQNSTIQHLYC